MDDNTEANAVDLLLPIMLPCRELASSNMLITLDGFIRFSLRGTSETSSAFVELSATKASDTNFNNFELCDTSAATSLTAASSIEQKPLRLLP